MNANHDAPGADRNPVDAHCLVCHSVRPDHADAIIARALTVETSKLYAALHYQAELREHGLA